jgi:hypothetical protein
VVTPDGPAVTVAKSHAMRDTPEGGRQWSPGACPHEPDLQSAETKAPSGVICSTPNSLNGKHFAPFRLARYRRG